MAVVEEREEEGEGTMLWRLMVQYPHVVPLPYRDEVEIISNERVIFHAINESVQRI